MRVDNVFNKQADITAFGANVLTAANDPQYDVKPMPALLDTNVFSAAQLNNAPAAPKNQGMSSMEDNVSVDFFLGGLFGGAGAGLNMGLTAAGSVVDFSDERGLSKAMEMERALQAPAPQQNPAKMDYKASSDITSYSKSELKAAPAFQNYIRPSDTDGKLTINMDMTPHQMMQQAFKNQPRPMAA